MRILPVILFLLVICVPVFIGIGCLGDGKSAEAIQWWIGCAQITGVAILTVLMWFKKI